MKLLNSTNIFGFSALVTAKATKACLVLPWEMCLKVVHVTASGTCLKDTILHESEVANVICS